MLSVREYSLVIFFIHLIITVVVNGTIYDFFFSSEDIFENCRGEKSMHDMLDLSNLNMEYSDGIIHVSGNMTNILPDTQPSDRVELSLELFKFANGNWQITPYVFVSSDFCTFMFDRKSPLYTKWFIHAPPQDQKCFNKFGHIYHFEPFTLEAFMDFTTNVEGRYKVVIYIRFFSTKCIGCRQTICTIIYGEVVKKL
ncbi:uncharacterized protein LOC142230538 [Haematobia irritans]|uniref:uncharacterized protein LOC142230538 n=1 Tax=Haematobia irritans TaxID=7368 RepID=UPI003F4F9E5A